MISVKTIRWQCSGCDHLCAMLVDESVSPETLTICPNSKWRIEETQGTGIDPELREKVVNILFRLCTNPDFTYPAWQCSQSESPDIVGLVDMPQFQETVDKIIALKGTGYSPDREKIEQAVYDYVYIGMNDGSPYLNIQSGFYKEIIALLGRK